MTFCGIQYIRVLDVSQRQILHDRIYRMYRRIRLVYTVALRFKTRSRQRDTFTEQASNRGGNDLPRESPGGTQPAKLPAARAETGVSMATPDITPAGPEEALGSRGVNPISYGDSADSSSQPGEESFEDDISSFSYLKDETGANITSLESRFSAGSRMQSLVKAEMRAEVKEAIAELRREFQVGLATMSERVSQLLLNNPKRSGDNREALPPTKEDDPPSKHESQPESPQEEQTFLKPGIPEDSDQLLQARSPEYIRYRTLCGASPVLRPTLATAWSEGPQESWGRSPKPFPTIGRGVPPIIGKELFEKYLLLAIFPQEILVTTRIDVDAIRVLWQEKNLGDTENWISRLSVTGLIDVVDMNVNESPMSPVQISKSPYNSSCPSTCPTPPENMNHLRFEHGDETSGYMSPISLTLLEDHLSDSKRPVSAPSLRIIQGFQMRKEQVEFLLSQASPELLLRDKFQAQVAVRGALAASEYYDDLDARSPCDCKFHDLERRGITPYYPCIKDTPDYWYCRPSAVILSSSFVSALWQHFERNPEYCEQWKDLVDQRAQYIKGTCVYTL